jgi:hypothetical protein
MMTNDETKAADVPMRVLLTGPDTLYFLCDLPISEAARDRLNEEKATALALADERRVHCPEWLGARVCPQGAKGGYAFLIETEDFSIKLLGEHFQNRPSVYIEMRSYALHTHPEEPQGACRAALAWVRGLLPRWLLLCVSGQVHPENCADGAVQHRRPNDVECELDRPESRTRWPTAGRQGPQQGGDGHVHARCREQPSPRAQQPPGRETWRGGRGNRQDGKQQGEDASSFDGVDVVDAIETVGVPS